MCGLLNNWVCKWLLCICFFVGNDVMLKGLVIRLLF